MGIAGAGKNSDSTFVHRSDLAELLNQVVIELPEYIDQIALEEHEADTTEVHGIADTSQLALKAEIAAFILLEDLEDAIAEHNADTTNVHGIADTTKLALKSELGGLGEEAVETKHIQNLAVTAGKLAAEAVETGKVKNLAVTAGKLAAESVEKAKIANGAVSAEKLEASAVTEEKIAAESVATGKIKNLAVTEGKIANEAVTTAKLAAEAVETGDIQNLAVTAGKLAAEAVEEGKIKANAVSEGKLSSAVQTKLKGANRESKTFTMAAGTEVKAESIGEFQLQLATGQTTKIVAMWYKLASGTKAKFSLKQNGTAVTGFKEKEAKSSEALESTGEVSVSNKDVLNVTVESVEGSPKGLSVSVILEHTH